MANANMDKYTAGFGLACIVASLLNTLILLVKETNPSVMNAMKTALGHHWTTHGAIVVVAYVALGFIFAGFGLGTKWDSQKMLRHIVLAVVIGTVIIAGFFLPHLKLAGTIKY